MIISTIVTEESAGIGPNKVKSDPFCLKSDPFLCATTTALPADT